MDPIRTFNLLGVEVAAVDPASALSTIDRWLADRDAQYVCVTGVHGVMESQRDPQLKRIHNEAGLVVPDGMPLVWFASLTGVPGVDRVYGPDLMLEVCRMTAGRDVRHFFYGGGEGVADLLVGRLLDRFPSLKIAGVYCPPFRALTDEEDAGVISMIDEARADIVWVGLSTPKQERWMAAHRGRIAAPVMLGVGAAFDFHAGLKPQAPYWMQRSGLEWSFRLMTEPRRLWRRYLVNNPAFLWLATLQLMGFRVRKSAG